jgi:hypothetical protein
MVFQLGITGNWFNLHNKQRKMTYIPPQIGDIKVQIRDGSNGTFIVQVDEFKENTLRGDAYWVTKVFKKYKKQQDAIKFASSFQ